MPPLRFSILVTSLWSISTGAVGCAGQSSETERQLQRMQERVAILQNERDRFDERITALEQQQEVWSQERASDRSGALLQRPALKVVRLEPEAPEGTNAAPDPAAASPKADVQAAPSTGERVLISGTGDKLTATQVPGGAE
jgi:TolA-binding protein